MNNGLPESIHPQVKKHLNPPLKFLLIILGLLLVVLLGETIFLTVMKNKNKNLNEKKQEETTGVEGKITPVSTGKSEKKTLIEGKVVSFGVDSRKITLILTDNTAKTVEVDDNTIFLYAKIGETQISPSEGKIVNFLTFWEGSKKNDRISYSSYENDELANLIVKHIVD